MNSNFEPERELAAVVLRVGGKERSRIAVKADGEPSIPFSFGVLPPGGDTSAKVTVEAEALSPDDLPLACPARAHVGFVAGEARVVQLELTRACGTAGCACGDSETCLQGECVSYDVDVSTLVSVEPGRELDGVERAPSTTLPEPERPVCNTDNGSWSDVGRALTKNYDGQLCPVMSDGTAWGSVAYSLDMNRQALSDYIDRHVEVEHDAITLEVAWIADELRVVGVPLSDADAPRLPTLEETLQLPSLQAAQQPLQLVFHDLGAGQSTALQTLPRLLLDAGVVQRCRPIYLTASGPASFGALRQLRESIRTQPRWSELWNVVHFGRRLTAVAPDSALDELNEAVAQGFQRVAIDVQRTDFPVLRRRARDLDVLIHFYNAEFAHELADLCDGSSGLEMLLSTERPPEIRFFDELRFQLSSARTLIDLDVGSLEAGATTFSYKGSPDLGKPRDVKLTAAKPTLVTGAMDTNWGDTDTVLRFSAELEQQLPLHDVSYNVEQPERKYFAWPLQTLMVTARLPVPFLPEGSRQVLVSKLRGESGWVLQFINEGGVNMIQYLWYGKGRDDDVVSMLKGQILTSTLKMQRETLLTIYVMNHRIAIESHEAGVLFGEMFAFHQHVMVTNDAPITLGADPDGGGYFDGDIQSVKISSMYEGFRTLK